MSAKRSPLLIIDALLDELVRKKVITPAARAKIAAKDGEATKQLGLSDRCRDLLWSFRSEASAALDTDASVTEIVAYIHRRIAEESAPPLEAEELAHRPREAHRRREILRVRDVRAIRSYAGQASTAFSRHATTSETLEYMIERLLKKRRGETK
jgi:hypothetical protein